jgi:TonB-dependent SusC/RagA subfamily outer membrane receptor
MEVTVGSQNNISVSLQAGSQQNMQEVVVVGYSTTTRQAFTGTAKVVSGEQLNNKNVSNVSQALAGEVAGVRVINTSGQPGTSATIRIRGIGSVNGNRDPLYVVDGVPYTGFINSINPNDIATMTVLKDAAATSIYGSRGANGVIVITTRNGRGRKSFIEADGRYGANMALLPRHEISRRVHCAWLGSAVQPGRSYQQRQPYHLCQHKAFLCQWHRSKEQRMECAKRC